MKATVATAVVAIVLQCTGVSWVVGEVVNGGEGDAEDGDSGCGCGMPSRGDQPDAAEAADDDDKACSAGGDDENNKELAEIARRALVDTPKVDMLKLPGGCFMMGSDKGFFPEDGEGPAFEVCVDGFEVDQHEVQKKCLRSHFALDGRTNGRKM